MARHHLARIASTKQTPQTQRIPGRSDQVKNDAGGFVFLADKWLRLRRWLILGSEGGSYYASEYDLTRSNIDALIDCINEDALRVLAEIEEVSHKGLAPRNDQAIFALAMVLASGDTDAKRSAVGLTPIICRTGTHIFMLADFIEATSGWGRAKRKAIAGWYESMTPGRLAYQLVKYRQRDGWTHRDLLRLSHPKGKPEHMPLYAWAVGRGADEIAFSVPIIEGYIQVQAAIDRDRVVELITEYNLPREALPTEALKHPRVWEALLYAGNGMPLHAMIRNLPTMTRVGLLGPLSSTVREVTDRLASQAQIQRSRVHPMQLLMARLTYASGRSQRGSAIWTPVPQIIDALDAAFYLAFQNVEPTGKRHLLGVDWSGSMGGTRYGSYTNGGAPTPAVLASAMALVTANVEPDYYVIAFATSAKPVAITKGMSLQEAYRLTGRGIGEGTDCSVPISVAATQGIDTDAFVIYTDNQTWAGKAHVTQTLDKYRKLVQHDVRFVAVGMNANEFTVADPNDTHSLNVVGFDASTPAVIANFVAGRI